MSLNNQRIEQWDHTPAKIKIKALVASHQTFTAVKQFFQIHHPEDEKIALTYYIEIFYENLPENIERHAYNIFESHDENFIAQWLEFIYGVRSNSDFEYLLKDIDFYKCLLDLKQYKENLSYERIFKTIQKSFRGIFLEIENFHGIIAIFQCLLRCERRSHHSTVFCDAVKILWKKCAFENDIINLEPDENPEIDVEHQRLAKLVNNFTGTDLENVKNLIKDLFKSTTIVTSILSHGIKESMLIEGHKIMLSTIHKDITKQIKNNTKIKSVIIRAKNLLILNENLTLSGITVSCRAAEVFVPNPITFNLSGKDAMVDQKNLIPANKGMKKGEKGKDGKDGTAGHSSGNFELYTKAIKGKENLNFILNGGNGTNGQDGGDGAEGEDGTGENFEKLDSITHELEQACKRFGRIVQGGPGGIGSSIFNKKIEIKKEDGSTKIINESPYYLSLHTVDFIKGSDGKIGGKGGKNGLGGEGGKSGKCKIKVNDIQQYNIKVESREGDPGQKGLPGENGGYGMEGWDIAKATKTFAKTKKYGTSLNEKLVLKYTNNKTDDTFRIVPEDEDNADNKSTIDDKKSTTMRYAYIEPRECIKKDLKEHEKRTEYKDESERSGEAIAKEAEALETESLAEEIEHSSTEKMAEKIQQEIEIDEEIDMNRVIEFVTDFIEDKYIAKERPQTFIFSSENDIENFNLMDDSSQIFWISTTEFSLENLFEKYKNTWVEQKLRKKHMVYKLRTEKKVEGPGKPQNTFSHAELSSLRKNVQQYYKIFCALRNIKINGKCVDYFLPNVKNAFKKKDVKFFAEHTVSSSSDPTLKDKISNPIFDDIRMAYDLLSDDIKQHDPILLFYYLKISENLAIYNIFSETALSEITENILKGIKKFLMLQKKRGKQAKNIAKMLQKYTKKYECIYDIGCTSQELQSRIDKILSYISPEASSISTYMFKEIEILSTTFPAVVNTFLNSLLIIFEVEGCHIDVVTLKYLIDTIFDACKMYGTISCYLFPNMLLAYPQELWLDEFVFFNLESSFNCDLNRKKFMETMKNFKDDNLKILCTQKVQNLSIDEALTEDKLLELLKALQSKTSIYPQLKDICLNEWIKQMEEINYDQNFKSPQWDALDEKKKNNVTFWFSKISAQFGLKNAKTVFKSLIELSHKNEHVVGRFMHRLCSNEYVIDVTTLPLKDILSAALQCLTHETFPNNDEECYMKAKELLIGTNSNIDLPIPRRLEDIKMLYKILNNDYSDEYVFQNVLTMVSTTFGDEITSVIESCASIDPKNHQSTSLYEAYEKKLEGSIPPKNLLLLEIFDKILFQTYKCNLRYTQKIAILSALEHYDPNAKLSGILQEVATGEGKTYIIAAVSIISALKGQCVNIITSSPVLAKRDVSLMQRLYDAFGLKVDHIYHTCSGRRKDVYSNCHIIYGDLTTYQRDYLVDKFHGTQISTGRAFQIVIVDEVDSLLLDNGLNTLYLSHNIADFEMLHSVIIQIWDLVNIQVKKQGKCKENESFYQKVASSLFPAISWKDFSKTLEISEIEVNDLKDILIESGIAMENGEIIVLKTEELEAKLENFRKNFETIKANFYCIFHAACVQQNDTSECSVDKLLDKTDILKAEAHNFISMLKQNGAMDNNNKILKTEKENMENVINTIEKQYFDAILRFQLKYDEIMNTMIVNIPEHLKPYVKMHLKEFIENAELALKMEADVEYQVTIPAQTAINEKAEQQIVIVDRDTGVHQPKAQWHKGLHQFLQLKHGLRLTALSIKAVFISNISYLTIFRCIFGFSGTMGSELEKEQLNKLYGLKSVVIPSSNVKQFYEERPIITSTQANHYKEIFNAIHEKLLDGRSILIIADSIKQVTLISTKIKEISEQLPHNQRKPFDSMILYKYDYENYLDKIDELNGKRIIIATNLAGRGIDIKLTKELSAKGGLHVIIAFHPRNIRIEEQAFGRAARCGEYGTAQLIIYDPSYKNDTSANIMELKMKRNMKEKERMQKITEHYENNIIVQQKCFSLFSKKFVAIKKELQKTKDEKKKNQIEKEKTAKAITANTNNCSQQIPLIEIKNINEMDNNPESTESFDSNSKDVDSFSQTLKNNETINEVVEEYDEYSKILVNDMLDKWALFLDSCEYEFTTADSKIKATEDFCNELEDKKNLEPTQPLNILRYAIVEINKRKYGAAKKHLEKLKNHFPAYAPEAKYYLVFITAKEKEGKKQFIKIEEELNEIKCEFSKRLNTYIQNSDIVKQYIVEEENRIFKCDTFMQQQKESKLFINQVIVSLDGFFGQMIKPYEFTTDRICEEASMFLFKYFSDLNIYGKNVPITGLQIKKIFDQSKLETYCKRNGISLSYITERLKALKEVEKLSEKRLQKEFGNPQWEDFWLELDEQKLLKDSKDHMFINTLKMPKLSASIFNQYILQLPEQTIGNRLYQHLFVTNSEWKEVDKDKVKENVKSELLELLKQNGIIYETKAAELSENISEARDVKFKQFFTITKNDLMHYGIAEDEADTILKKLVNDHVLTKLEKDNYQLSSMMMNDAPEWYNYIAMKMIKQKLAFDWAFLIIKSDITLNKETLLNLSFIFNNDDETFVSELIEAGILENTNVNLANLNKVRIEENIIRKQWERFCDSEASFNILKALEAAEEFFEKLFGEESVTFSIKKIKWYKGMLPNPDIVKINQIFDESASINQKWKTFDIKLVPIKEIISNESENSHLMITHGVTHLINFHEKRWSKKALKKATGITALGLLQLGCGCASFIPGLAISATGIGAVAAAAVIKPLIFEGINDIFFGLKSFYTGRSDGWLKYKMINMALNLTFIGGTQMLKFVRFAEFSLLKAIFSRTDAAITGTINAGKHAISYITSSFLEVKEKEDKYLFVQKGTTFAVEEIYKEIQTHINNIFESNEHMHELHDTVKKYLQKFGANSNCIADNDNFNIFLKAAIFEICYTAVAALRTSILEDKEITKENTFEIRIKNIIHSADFKKLMASFEKKLLSSIKQMNKILTAKINRANMEQINRTTQENEEMVNIKSIELIEHWKLEIQKRCNALLKEKIEIPLNYENEAEYQKKMNEIVKKAYSELKNHGNVIDTLAEDSSFKSITLSKKLEEEFKSDFFSKMNQIQQITQDPEFYATALLNGISIDAFGADILSKFISRILSMQIIVKNFNTKPTDNTTTIEIIICQNSDIAEDKNRVYDQIIHHLPDITNHFGSEIAFQKALAMEIAESSSFFTRINDIAVSDFNHDFEMVY